ncbi:helix-turn-helix domain-containing protein [Nocardia amikacinitolerans]|uniref:helix-turn-helix domain-containing protein n=1 Tax=Nocardia amikacinitolerans TaxID=756689 RepID=UPI00082CC348|nr:helix-turn-helix domain-containing protein [Nocardia amikacinitolerans]
MRLLVLPNNGLSPSEPWHQALAAEFNGLRAQSFRDQSVQGTLRTAHFGEVDAYDVMGTAQVLLRSPAAAREQPTESLKVCLLTRGHGVVEQHGREVALAAGQLALYDLSQPYRLTFQRGWRGTVLAFPRSALQLAPHDIDAAMRHAHTAITGPGPVLTDLVADYTADELTAPPPTHFLGSAAVNLVTSIVWASLTDDRASPTDILRRQAEHFIRVHISDPSVTADTVAAAHHVSPRTLQRAFAAAGETVSEFIRNERLCGARRDLLAPGSRHVSIAAIAARWCFFDAPHFSRAFRAAFGVAPSELRTRPGPAQP